MKVPTVFKVKKNQGYSLCMGCDRWRFNMIFRNEGSHLILCRDDYEDYWFNEDTIAADYKGY